MTPSRRPVVDEHPQKIRVAAVQPAALARPVTRVCSSWGFE
jgi:hypothetical protein